MLKVPQAEKENVLIRHPLVAVWPWWPDKPVLLVNIIFHILVRFTCAKVIEMDIAGVEVLWVLRVNVAGLNFEVNVAGHDSVSPLVDKPVIEETFGVVGSVVVLRPVIFFRNSRFLRQLQVIVVFAAIVRKLRLMALTWKCSSTDLAKL